MSNWKKKLKQFSEGFGKSDLDLRHGVEKVFISSLASQLYCENKLNLDIIFQPGGTQEQIQGTEIHEFLIPIEKISIDEIIETIESGKEIITIFPVYFTFKGVIISGITDGVLFRDEKPIYLFEIKTTKGSIDKIWPGELLQAKLYCYALEFMGFNVNDLLIVIPKVKQEIDKKSLIKTMIKLIDKAKKGKKSIKIPNVPIRIHILKYSNISKLDFELTLNRLITFWTEDRKPHHSGNPAKCKPCQYVEECQFYKNGVLID
ncbi:MAG: hypothetical protein HeimC3_15620 [Candidatus Heimdallarchaeota archaeon LC_3]|nr:MAG: hypothetical protein HeimC3_15620 [Candidatus Heimdallarchaeota archaeon LC_3]